MLCGDFPRPKPEKQSGGSEPNWKHGQSVERAPAGRHTRIGMRSYSEDPVRTDFERYREHHADPQHRKAEDDTAGYRQTRIPPIPGTVLQGQLLERRASGKEHRQAERNSQVEREDHAMLAAAEQRANAELGHGSLEGIAEPRQPS